jgi:hypothetical protein
VCPCTIIHVKTAPKVAYECLFCITIFQNFVSFASKVVVTSGIRPRWGFQLVIYFLLFIALLFMTGSFKLNKERIIFGKPIRYLISRFRSLLARFFLSCRLIQGLDRHSTALHCGNIYAWRNMQTRLLVREGAPHQQTRDRIKVIKERRRQIGRGSQMGAWHQERLADWLLVAIDLSSIKLVTGQSSRNNSCWQVPIDKTRRQKMELVRAMWVKCCCGCGTEIVREARKGNVRRCNAVPEDWWWSTDRGDSVRV